MKHKPRKSKYSIQRKEYFSIRKFKFGAASALIGVSLFATASVLAEEQPQTQSTVVAVQSSEGSAGQKDGLPDGLVYDSATGKIEGQVAQAGSYTILSQASVEATNPDGTYVGSGAVTYVTESHLYVAEQNGPGLPSISLTANPINASAVSAQPTQSGGSVFRAVTGENPVGTVHLGDNATPSNNHDTAIGYYAETNVDLDNKGGAVALGTYTKANGENAIAIGNTANAGANSAIALGGKASGVGAINIGYTASADAPSSVSIGYYANAQSSNSVALGTQAKSEAILASAIGPSAQATYYNSVALGAGSITDSDATTEDSATINNITYSGVPSDQRLSLDCYIRYCWNRYAKSSERYQCCSRCSAGSWW